MVKRYRAITGATLAEIRQTPLSEINRYIEYDSLERQIEAQVKATQQNGKSQ